MNNLIPEELLAANQWVNWKVITRDGKETKIPIQPNGVAASSTDPQTWRPFNELSQSQPAGFVFTDSDNFIGIDLDGCREVKTGRVEDWAFEIISELNTYCEISPSGTGVKLFATCDSDWQHKNKVHVANVPETSEKQPGIEVYDRGRYFAVTARRLPGYATIRNVTEKLNWLADRYGMKQEAKIFAPPSITIDTPIMERASKYIAKMDPSISGSRGHDACFKAACVLVLGFDLDQDKAYTILANDFNPRCDPPWSERELRHKVASAAKQPGQRGYLSDASPKDWPKIYIRTPVLSEAELSPDEDEPVLEDRVKATTLAEATVRYIEQLATEGEGLIQTGMPEFDYAVGGGVELGEMVVIAGRPSHGKTAIAMQMVHEMTSRGHRTLVVSEEMTALSLGKRALQYISPTEQREWVGREEELIDQVEEHFSSRESAFVLEGCGSVERVVQEAERMIHDEGVSVIAVDYVQLLSASGGSRYEQVSEASKAMSRLAKQNNVLVIVLAQMSRAIEERKEFTPMMSDLKESGQIEQDADVILFGVWPYRLDPNREKGEYLLFIAKCRNRELASPTCKVTFEPERQRWIEDSSKPFFIGSGEKVERFAEFDDWS